jgi:hypothetical protein
MGTNVGPHLLRGRVGGVRHRAEGPVGLRISKSFDVHFGKLMVYGNGSTTISREVRGAQLKLRFYTYSGGGPAVGRQREAGWSS